MKLFVTLKHWQLFLLLFGIPFILVTIIMSLAIAGKDPAALLFTYTLVFFLFMGLFFTWFYSLGTNLYKKLPITVSSMRLTRFKIFLFVPVLYILLLIAFVSRFFSSSVRAADTHPNPAFFALLFPIHLFCMFCLFYCLYFVAKELKTAEWRKPVTFGDFAGEFFLLWFFPLGIWFLQPRINKLFSTTEATGETSDSLFAN